MQSKNQERMSPGRMFYFMGGVVGGSSLVMGLHNALSHADQGWGMGWYMVGVGAAILLVSALSLYSKPASNQ